MGMEDFHRYMNDLETLSEDIAQAPEFKMDADGLSRTELRHRFNLHRALVNLLRIVTVHMMRADAPDYDMQSERWILSALDKAAEDIRDGLGQPLPANAQRLAERAQNLANRILADIHTIAA
jgi:hypothetical protein